MKKEQTMNLYNSLFCISIGIGLGIVASRLLRYEEPPVVPPPRVNIGTQTEGRLTDYVVVEYV